MKDIFRKIGQGLGSLATDFPARQETLDSAKEEPGIKRDAELASPPEVGSAPAQAPLNAQELRFHGGGEGKPGRVAKKLGRNGKSFPPSCRRPSAASRPG